MFDDWMVSLRLDDRKLLSVALLQAFNTRQGMLVMDAAKESASFTGFNEKTVRRYRKQFFDGKGRFENTKQGKYERHCLLNEEELRLDVYSNVGQRECIPEGGSKYDGSKVLSVGK